MLEKFIFSKEQIEEFRERERQCNEIHSKEEINELGKKEKRFNLLKNIGLASIALCAYKVFHIESGNIPYFTFLLGYGGAILTGVGVSQRNNYRHELGMPYIPIPHPPF